MNIIGTKFQLKVWDEIKKIPKGKTVSYKYIAQKIDKLLAYIALANACAKNPLPKTIPCNRVIKQNAKLGGYFMKKNLIKKILLEQESQQ